jgi:hypothetical protein
MAKTREDGCRRGHGTNQTSRGLVLRYPGRQLRAIHLERVGPMTTHLSLKSDKTPIITGA